MTDLVQLRGETRSHDPAFLKEITAIYRKAFDRAAKSVKNHQRKTGKVRFQASHDYQAFRLERSEPVVRFTAATLRSLGRKPNLTIVDGGLDANYLYEKGVPTVTLGAGQHSPHTVNEYVDIRNFLGGCELLLAVATQDM